MVIKRFAKNKKYLNFCISFAAGAMIAVSFFDLLPEAIAKQSDVMKTMEMFVIGFILFLLLEKSLIYYHCHEENCLIHSSTKLVMLGDTLHNFLDGVAIAASFFAGAGVGFFTTIAIAIHEIPQEVGDFGVLIHGGYSKNKALLFNFFSAAAAISGGIIGYLALNKISVLIPYLLAITAGGFTYVATADLLPEINHQSNTRPKILQHSLIVVLGILIIWAFGKYL